MRYECHVTTEFVDPTDRRVIKLQAICMRHLFRLAKLYKENRETSDLDTFMTGHADSYDVMHDRMRDLIHDLKEHQFKVTRYKIEEILLDSRNGD